MYNHNKTQRIMDKVIKHKFRNREVVLIYNIKKNLVCYVLNSLTPNTRRVLKTVITKDKLTVKDFLK